MTLKDWLNNGWLRRHPPSAEETQSLLDVVDRDLHDCQARGLSDDWKFNIAYNAALQLARIALHAAGYDVPKGDSQHLRSIESLRFTIVAKPDLIDRFQRFRKKRSAGVYEAAGMISPTDARDMIALATGLKTSVVQWLQSNHAKLLE